MLALLVDGTRLPLLGIEHPSRCAFVARLVRIKPAQTLVSVRPRPAPGMERAPQSKPESVHPFHDFGSANYKGTRVPARQPAADLGI